MRALPLVALVVVLAACDSGEPAPPRFGQFEAELSGGLSRSLVGTATFGRLPAGPGEPRTLTVTLIDGTALLRSISFGDLENALDGEGTYDLARGGPLQLFYMDGAGSEEGPFSSTAGTLRITRFGDDRVSGTFTAELAPAFEPDGDPTVSVSGTFDAVRLRTPF